ncbi:hypothetical protein ACFWM3_02320 [Gottfriedia sp. NPDC058432]
MKVKKGIIPTVGLGTRFISATKAMPNVEKNKTGMVKRNNW